MSTFDPKVKTQIKGRYRYRPSYYSRVTTRMGDLVPVLCKKINPSDRFRINLASVTRLAPVANPVYDRLRIDYDAFFVQNRIIDPDFKAFYTGGIGLFEQESTEGMKDIVLKCSAPTSSYEHLKLFGTGSLLDNLGFQFPSYTTLGGVVGVPDLNIGTTASSFEFHIKADKILAYHKIVDSWYINERYEVSFYDNIMKSYNSDSRSLSTSFSQYGEGYDLLNLRHRNYQKDLYTTALAEPLIGGPVNIPMDGKITDVYNLNNNQQSTGRILSTNIGKLNEVSPGSSSAVGTPIYLSLKNAVTTTLQELNNAYAVFRFFMTDTYNGNRYVEFVQAHFGVTVPDSTLERPLFLGRITQQVGFSEIYQTSGATNEDNALGDYSGKGLSVGSGFLFDTFFEEAGYIMIIMSIRPDSTYFQGVDPDFFVGDRFESFYFPEFQNIGDEEIPTAYIYNNVFLKKSAESNGLVKAVYNTSAKTSDVFGYNRRNYRYIWYPNEMHGNYLLDNQNLNWTFARKFSSAPLLGETFNKVPNITNPFTFRNEDGMYYYTDLYFDIQCLRQIDKYETFTSH